MIRGKESLGRKYSTCQVKRRGSCERCVSTGNLNERGLLDLEIYAVGELQEKIWNYVAKEDLGKVGRRANDEFFTEFAGTTILHEREVLRGSLTMTYR